MSLRLIANENVPAAAVTALRSRGHDIVSVRIEMPGCDDAVVLRRARDEGRLVLTFDKDFGELAFRSRLSSPAGVVLFRLKMTSSARFAALATSVLESREDWPGHFAVIEDSRIRMTPLPIPEGTDR